jgi:hypothetical protein
MVRPRWSGPPGRRGVSYRARHGDDCEARVSTSLEDVQGGGAVQIPGGLVTQSPTLPLLAGLAAGAALMRSAT